MSAKKIILILFLVDLLVFGIFSWHSGGFLIDRTDTRYFVAQMDQFRGIYQTESTSQTMQDMVYFRGSKPFYAIVGWALRFFSSRQIMFLLNLIFLFCLTLAAYYLFRLMNFNDKISLWGAAWIAGSYPMYKYGLALMTDISGWFFAAATMVLFFYGLKRDKIGFLFLASLVAFLGALSKETGVMGIVFAGLYLLISYKEWGVKETFKKLLVLCLPFLVLYGALSIVLHFTGAPSFVQWYKYNYDIYFHDFYKLRYFLTNEFLSLNAVYISSLIGFWYLIKNKEYANVKWRAFFFSALVPSLLVLLWPAFAYRTIFIQFIFFVPIALYGLSNLDKKEYKLWKFPLSDYLGALPMVLSVVLFFLIQKM